jgi:2-polyprenyl-3-methyl-5-hydroxy-6-metoxy-1,4-benzoquinol methylase
MSSNPDYVLQSERAELERLAHQARSLEAATLVHLQLSGIRPGMRVLDLGTGIGDVAFHVADLVGPAGSVVGIDLADSALAYAEERRAQSGRSNVRFEQADVRTWRDATGEPFDAVVGRLILFHLPKHAVEIVQHHAGQLRPGGIVLMMDFDVGGARSEPPIPLAMRTRGWIMEAFARAGADPVIGVKLEGILRSAGLRNVRSVGLAAYLDATDPAGPQLMTGVVRSLLPAIERTGVATAEEVSIDTLADRLGEALRAADAVLLPPTLVGAVGQSPT